jgi:hypothetical protein
MKIAQFCFRFFCFAVAIIQLGIMLNNAILDIDNFETNNIELSDSDSNEPDLEDKEEENNLLSVDSHQLFLIQNIDVTICLKKIKFSNPNCKLLSEIQSVPFSPPDLKV